MRLKNILIVVNNIEASKKYYHDLFGLDAILDNDGNMILTEGLVLQEEKYWTQFINKEPVSKNNHSELYFEEKNIEAFIEKLEKLYPETEYVNKLMTHSLCSAYDNHCDIIFADFFDAFSIVLYL